MTNKPLPNVFVHGSFANSQSWKKIRKLLGEQVISYAVDLPGHGKCPKPDDYDDPHISTEFASIRAQLDGKLKWEDGIHLIGHSYGGVVALGAAMTGALPVKRLTLFEPVDVSVLPIFGETDAVQQIEKFVDGYLTAYGNGADNVFSMVIDFWGGSGSYERLPPHIVEQMIPMTRDNIRHWHMCKENGKAIEEYQTLNIPITLVHGSESNDVARAICSSLHRNLPNSALHIINGASHFMITSHAEESAEILKNQL